MDALQERIAARLLAAADMTVRLGGEVWSDRGLAVAAPGGPRLVLSIDDVARLAAAAAAEVHTQRPL